MKWYLMVFKSSGHYYCIITSSLELMNDIAETVSEIFRVETDRNADDQYIKNLVIKARAKAREMHVQHVHDLDDQWTFTDEVLPAVAA